MSVVAAGPPAGEPHGAIAFDRAAPGLTGLAVKGYLLTLVTFTIYRFWYVSDLRRFFWGRTLVLGSPAEYVGRGRELFLGFLVALAVLVPLYLGLFVLSLTLPALGPFAGLISFVVLFLLGQYALYRGRRYRASRTLWRGIRLGQDGSGASYAARAAAWGLLTLATLGLAFPFMRASLERYRIDHTLVGRSRMRSEARGTQVLGPWLLIYLVGLGPILLAGIALFAASDFTIPRDLFVDGAGGEAGPTLNPAYAGTPIGRWGPLALGAAAIGLPLAALLVPFYRARETRAFMNAAFLGEARLACTLRARQFYWPYIVYMLSILGYLAVLGIAGALLALALARGGAGGAGRGGDVLSVLAGFGVLALYLGSLLLFAVLYVRVVTLRLWHAVATATAILNPEAVEAVLAPAQGPGSGLNQGLADALDVGGAIEIGF